LSFTYTYLDLVGSVSTGGLGGALWIDTDYIYTSAVVASINYIAKYLKSDLSLVTMSPDVVQLPSSIWGDDVFIYVVAYPYIKKYQKSDLLFATQSPEGQPVNLAIWGDNTYVYAGKDDSPNVLRKFLKSDLTFVTSIAGACSYLCGDDFYLYAAGFFTMKKVLPSDLSSVWDISYYGWCRGLCYDDAYLYTTNSSNSYPGEVKQFIKDDGTYVGTTPSPGGYYAGKCPICCDDTYLFAGFNTYIRMYNKTDLVRIKNKSTGIYIGSIASDPEFVYVNGASGSLRKYRIITFSAAYYPSDAMARVSSIRRIYRPGLYRMEVALGDLGFDWDVSEAAMKKITEAVKEPEVPVEEPSKKPEPLTELDWKKIIEQQQSSEWYKAMTQPLPTWATKTTTPYQGLNIAQGIKPKPTDSVVPTPSVPTVATRTTALSPFASLFTSASKAIKNFFGL